MGSYLIVGLVLVFFVISLFIGKLQSWRGTPYVYSAVAAFFLVNMYLDGREGFLPNLLFAAIATGYAVKYFRRKEFPKTPESD